jgi:pre-mRNA-splicing factor 18
MDLLKKELERKKKNVEKAKSSSEGGRRYFRTKDFRRLQDTEDDEQLEQRQQMKKRKKTDSDDNESEESNSKNVRLTTEDGKAQKPHGDNQNDNAKSTADEGEEEKEGVKTLKMPPEEITQRLRSLGYPIMLFGESSRDRLKRLRTALDKQKNVQALTSENDEFRLGKGHGIRNPFLEKEKYKKNDHHAEEAMEDEEKGNKGDSKEKQDESADLLDENDPHKRVYRYFKNLLNQWEEDLAMRPESVKKSVAGRNETKTLKQCKDYIRPMFKLCKRRNMDESILNQLNKIVSFCLEEKFVKAHDTYIDISIGRAAWPIGVTMVGIHARTGRAKIESSNVAHVMNSELQRKYLTSVKRLMTYAQKKSNANPSNKVMN